MSEPYDVKTVVLRKNMELDDATAMAESKKTKPFQSLLSRPKKEQIHLQSIGLYYECVLVVSGRYVADYYRRATHTISVPSNVNEVVLGDGVFPIRSKSGLEKAFAGKKGRNKIDINLEEHVFVAEEDRIAFDHHGDRIEFSFKTGSEAVENYPKRLLQKSGPNVRRPEMTYDAALDALQSQLKKPLESDVRDLTEEFALGDITEFYVPVFEARLDGPKKRVEMIRIDAVRKKIL